MGPTTKMKAQKPSKVVKPKKDTKRTTVTSKNHRFQTFSERISKLKIDPIRRRRGVEEREELSEDTATYFGRSLEEWRDLNLSKTFTSFSRDVTPLCDSLPMLLHNEETVIDLLMEYIEKGDALAEEPLLNLLSHFAHDLDTRFEKHFQRAVAVVTSVAAKHPDPAVVEWCFNSLAWQFKYLSRVLIPNLRPLYDLMSPYLGKESQKPFVIRFAAESLSFLIRKAAASYEKDPEPLDLIVEHILQDCKNANTADLYQQGVLTIFTEAIKGVQNGIHSSGQAVLHSLLKQTKALSRKSAVVPVDILTGTLTSLIHFTNKETFSPIQETVINYINSSSLAEQAKLASCWSQLMLTITSVRKGTRVDKWSPIISLLRELVQLGQDDVEMDTEARLSTLSFLAATLQTAPINDLLAAVNLFQTVRRGAWSKHFLQFCDLFARLGRERFQTFLFPEFQRFVLEQWQNREEGILMLLPILPLPKQQLSCSEEFQTWIAQQIGLLDFSGGADLSNTRLGSVNLLLAALPRLKLDKSTWSKLQSELVKVVENTLEAKDDHQQELHNFAMGECLACLLESRPNGTASLGMWSSLCNASPHFVALSRFWSNLLRYAKMFSLAPEDLEGAHMSQLEGSLLKALTLPSHDIRQAALEIMQMIYKNKKHSIPEILPSAATIESTPISLESSRSISMNIRRLGSGYSALSSNALMQKAIPMYCFGLLHVQLSQAWEDAVSALAEMSKIPSGEEVIATMAQTWLDGEPSEPEDHQNGHSDQVLDAESSHFQVASDFECSNFAKVSAICRQVFEGANYGYPSVERRLHRDHARTPLISLNARQQALKVLDKMPNIAEKRSRMLVPVLLRWAGTAKYHENQNQQHTWSRKDQKAMLAIFAQFNNPKVLFKSGEAYDALLNLCANGDVEIQRSALKAILAWKDPAVKRFEERLTNLLDEARFRDEISVFLQGAGEDEERIEPDHYPSLMPVLLRLLYGRAVAGGKQGQSSRRKMIFSALSRYGENVLGLFVDIAIGSPGDQGLKNGVPDEAFLDQFKTPLRQQFGMLNMVDDMLETLGSELEPFAHRLFDAVLGCTINAARRIDRGESDGNLQDASLLRSIRQVGIQCLSKIYSAMSNSDFSARTPIVAEELIVPRLDKFATENTQSISGTLRLLSAWSDSHGTATYLIAQQGRALASLAQLLRQESAKDEVQLFVLQEILDNLLREGTVSVLSDTQITDFVRSIGDVINRQPSKDLLDACVDSFTKLAAHITDEEEVKAVTQVCNRLLTKPSKVVSPRTKAGLLHTLSSLLENFSIPVDSPLYNALCGLFSRMQHQESRSVLSAVFKKLCSSNDSFSECSQICEDLNASGDRLDEPDLERREQGFAKIYEKYKALSARQWQPIVHNCLFYIKDTEDLVNRSSAGRALERFIDAASENLGEFKPMLTEVILPGFEYGMKQSSELVRAEYIRLLGHLVEMFPEWAAVSDMKTLTFSGDDEASFFTNVLHIQQHRRLRTLRRLSEEASAISSSHVTKIFMPTLEHFVFDPVEGDAGRTLADQTVSTLGALAKALNFSSFRATFRRYAGYLKADPEHEKVTLRLLGSLVEALGTKGDVGQQTSGDGIGDDKAETIKRYFLPPLVDYLHLKDESTVDRRMPVAVTIVKLLLLLPEQEMSSRLPPVLTDVCHVLRSRSQEARDETRKALAAILTLIGPAYFGYILKELRVALQRGYQLHVLSFTSHSLLVNAVDGYQPGDLDPCLSQLMSIVMDDIFGVTGQEKDAEEYKTGMKEIKSSKSFDTMELLARVTPVQRLGQLIRPIRSLLFEKLDSRMVKKIDDLLMRMRKGIDQNPAADSREMLMFCHEVIRQVYAEQNATDSKDPKADSKFNRFLVKKEPASKSKSKTATSAQTFKLVSFALGLLRKVLRRHEDLQTPANLAGFLPIIGDATVQGQNEVQLSALRLLGTIMKVPLNDLESNAPVYVKEAVRLIKTSPSMTTDSAKAALELITSVLREKRSVNIRDRDIGEVLNTLKNDLDEPEQQVLIYKFLRAVIGRKIMATEVYEVMDRIAQVVVTNADRNVRESARGAYIQFITDYPQSKDRWNKQAAFFVENLKYEHRNGRQSVMELLHRLLSKASSEALAQLTFTLFVALVPVQVNDPDQECRQMAGMLIAKIFEVVDEDQLTSFMTLMERWLQNASNPTIQSAALQCWEILLRNAQPETKRIEGLRDGIDTLLNDDDLNGLDSGNVLLLNALQTFTAMVEFMPKMAYSKASSGVWRSLQRSIIQPRTDVQITAARLLELYFSHVASASSKTASGLSAVPLQGSNGLELTADDMRQLCYSSLKVLRDASEDSEETLASQTVRNLVFLGRCFEANKVPWHDVEDFANGAEDSDEDEPGQSDRSTALAYLLNRLSYIIRQERFTTTSRIAAMDAQMALINHVEAIPDLNTLLRPLYSLTDTSIPRQSSEAHTRLVEKAQGFMETIQKKVGKEAYLTALASVRAEAKTKREERRQKRKIEAVSAPEKWAKDKRKKYDAKKAKSKERGLEARGRRRGW